MEANQWNNIRVLSPEHTAVLKKLYDATDPANIGRKGRKGSEPTKEEIIRANFARHGVELEP